jgi:putative acetyltransferase
MSKAQTTVRIRPRAPGDDAEIAEVLTAAFRGADEARLVERLRRDGDCVCELVALDKSGAVVGHVLYSRLEVKSASQSLNAVALAPLAVRPDVQRSAIGDTLTRAGLKACAEAGCELAVVLGHPAYYPRFGFSALLAKLLEAPYAGPSFMALELKPGVLDGLKWSVTYPRAFSSA